MILSRISLKNFRQFEELSISFDSALNVIVGKNGSGKSGILDAITIALGGYLAGFDSGNKVMGRGLSNDDARLVVFPSGSGFEVQKQYPVEIEAEAHVREDNGDTRSITWKRVLAQNGGKTRIAPAKAIMQYASDLQTQLSKQNKKLILPIIAYYGTGRLFRHKAEKKISFGGFNRLRGYSNCLDAASDEKSFWQWFKRMSDIEYERQEKVPELEVVKRAMGQCFVGRKINFENSTDTVPQFRYMADTGEFEIFYSNDKGIVRLPFRMLSDGERVTVRLVADIAYRMANLNPDLLDRITDETPGVVLIDEIDLHLHPGWQKRILADLRYIFPKVQFIVTTHSPFIVTNIETPESIVSISNQKASSPSFNTYARDIDNLLRVLMDADVQPNKVADLKEKFYDSVDAEQRDSAEKYLRVLENLLGVNHPEYIKAKIAFDLNFDLGDYKE